jgi:phosphate transport system permease protein
MNKNLEEGIMVGLMIVSTAFVVGSLLLIVVAVAAKGLPALSLAMLTQAPRGGYYLGKEGGILNAITGSLALAGGATAVSFFAGLGVALYLGLFVPQGSRPAQWIRLALDVLWGVPSIVYGAFGFALLLLFKVRASLLGGIIALALLQLPIVVRGIDEVISAVPRGLKGASYALGATRLETALRVVVRQAAPGIVTVLLLAFGRGIGDAASVLFTAGYTDRLPSSLLRPVASLPLAVFFQLGTPLPEVQQRAYAAALVLLIIVLAISLLARLLARMLDKHVVR